MKRQSLRRCRLRALNQLRVRGAYEALKGRRMRREAFINRISTFKAEEPMVGFSGREAWLGRHLPSDVRALLEVMPAGGVSSVQRVWDEWRKGTEGVPEWERILEHGVVEGTGSDTVGGRPYLIREWQAGEDLATLIRSRRFVPFEAKLRVVAQASLALDRLHERGLFHCFLRPRAIRICDEGRVQIEPPGLVSAGDPRQRRYAAPERDRAGASAPGDLFSLALILFEWITFRHPFEAPLLEDVLQAVHERRVLLNKALPGVSSRLNAALRKAMAKSPDRGFASGRDLAEVLLQVTPTLADGGGRIESRLDKARRRFEELVAPGVGELGVDGFFDSDLTRIAPPDGESADYGNRLLLLRAYEEGAQRWIRRRDQAKATHDLLAKAREALDQGEYPVCFSNLDAVFRIHPDNRKAAGLRDRCIVKARAEDERRLCLSTALALARKALAARNYQRCLQILDQAQDFDEPDSQMTSLRRKAQAGLKTVLAHYAERVTDALDEAKIDNAAKLCRAGLEVDPEHTRLLGLQSRIRAAQQDRARQVDDLVGQVRDAVAADRPAEGLRLAEEAIELDPDHEGASAAWREASEARLRRRRVGRMDELMTAFTELGDDQRAVETGRLLLKMAPNDADAASRLREAEASLRGDQLGDDTSVKGLIDSARHALQHQRRSSGRRLLRFALQLVPQHPEAEEIRSRLKGSEDSPSVRPPVPVPVPPERVPSPRPRRLWPWMGAVATVALVFLVAFPGSNEADPPTSAPEGLIRLAPLPWARLETLQRVEGDERIPLPESSCQGAGAEQSVTPCVLRLPIGRYRIVLTHPDFGRDEQEVVVEAGSSIALDRLMPRFDPMREVESELADLMPAEEGGVR